MSIVKIKMPNLILTIDDYSSIIHHVKKSNNIIIIYCYTDVNDEFKHISDIKKIFPSIDGVYYTFIKHKLTNPLHINSKLNGGYVIKSHNSKCCVIKKNKKNDQNSISNLLKLIGLRKLKQSSVNNSI